jgi:hypothetical protein
MYNGIRKKIMPIYFPMFLQDSSDSEDDKKKKKKKDKKKKDVRMLVEY